MPKNKQSSKQHSGQSSRRDRRYRAGGEAGGEKYKPGFPMNIFSNSKMFYVMGLSVMLGGLLLAFLLQNQSPSHSASNPDPVDQPTATASVEPTATATPDPRHFTTVDEVVLADVYDYTATFATAKGEFTVNLFQDDAPRTVNTFVFLAEHGYYNGLTFLRVVDGFIAQAGDPNNIRNDGNDDPGVFTPQEPSEIKNTQGTISMARQEGQPTTSAQFFINLKDNPSLDFDNNIDEHDYPFAEITDGLDVVLSLVQDDEITFVRIEKELKPGAVEPTPTSTPEATPTPRLEVSYEAPEDVIDAEAFDYAATIETEKGNIEIDLFADVSPRTVNSFVFLSQEGFFDNIIVQRYEPEFVMQAGDPTGQQGDGYDGPGYTVEEDVNQLRNDRGRLSMAKQGGATVFGSQWFINLGDNAGLDAESGGSNAFYPFGEVTEGMDIVDTLVVGDQIIRITITETAK